jgi:hypothetical protein
LRRTLAGILLLMATPALLLADEGVGTAGYSFLTLGGGARAAALGTAATAIAEGADAMTWNPALLARLRGPTAAASGFNWLEDVSVGEAAGSFPLGKWGVLGAAFRSLRVSDFGNVPGEAEIGQSDQAFTAGLGRRIFSSLDAGVALKVVRSSLAGEKATGWATDLGLNYDYVEGWNLAAALRNAGPAFGYVDGVEEPLPTQAAFGLGGTLGELRVGSEVVWENGPGWVGALGAEYLLLDHVALRAGSRLMDEPDGAVEPWSAGVGLRLRSGFELDYAFRDGTIAASHRVGVRWAPSRWLEGEDRKASRSHRELYISVLDQVLDESLVDFPEDVGDTVQVMSASPHAASEVVTETVAEYLRARGIAASVRPPKVEIPDNVSPEVAAQIEATQGSGKDHPLLTCDIRQSEFSILSRKRMRWIGPLSVERRADVELGFSLTTPQAGQTAWSSSGRASVTETVAGKSIRPTAGYPAGHIKRPTVSESKLKALVEPAIVGGIVSGLVLIFFSNRDVGE